MREDIYHLKVFQFSLKVKLKMENVDSPKQFLFGCFADPRLQKTFHSIDPPTLTGQTFPQKKLLY